MNGPPLARGSMGFLLSFTLAYGIMSWLGGMDFVLSPLLVAIAISATSLGILVPVLSDTGQIDTPMGRFTMGGSSAAEIGTIGMLGVFFAGHGTSASVSALLLAAVAVIAIVFLFALRTAARWHPGRRIFDRLDDSSAQPRVRFAVMILVAAAALAMRFGFEGILGTFVAGIVVGVLMRGDRFEKVLHAKLKVIGFGLFVPAFFVTSGLRFQLDAISGFTEVGRAAVFLLVMVIIHTIPTLLYRPHLGWRECLASGLMQSTNLSFIVVAVTVGTELGEIREVNAAALVLAGLFSAIVMPALALWLLGDTKQSATHPAGTESAPTP